MNHATNHDARGAGSLVHERIAARCRATPEGPAVTDGCRTWSGAELDGAAERIAAKLRAAGARPDARVVLFLPRSLDQVAALLGVLKAGAAYVPLDVELPDDRVRFILEDSGAVAIVTDRARAARLPASLAAAVVLVDNLPTAETRASAPDSSSPCPVDPDALAYVIYTSGTTGRPKGVLIPHRALANHCAAIVTLYGLGATDRVLQFTSISFDVAAEEIIPTLAAGGCVVLRSDAATGSMADFVAFLSAQRVTVANLPAPYWHELVAEMAQGRVTLPPSLRLVIAGSERVLPERLADWRRLVPAGVRWLNGYGPTETTITATVYEPGPLDDLGGCVSVPIGRPIAGVTAYVVDDQLRAVPPGEPGELCIGGAGVARGYLGLDALTAERFVRDPFASSPDARLYRTGDLARWRADGNLEFLGRADGQVKFRGFRIELGEIEATLARHPAVRAAAAALREDAPGRAYLVGYVVLQPGAAASSADLRAFARSTLPDYMVPAVVVTLDALPLTPGGKIDRRALPAPDRAATASREIAPPRNARETMLVGRWQALLGIDPLSIHDDFFELGGHSLLATRLVADLRSEEGLAITVVDVFAHPTIARLAARLDEVATGGNVLDLPPIRRFPREGRIPLAFSQEPIWFLNQMEPGLLAYNTQLTVRFQGPLRIAALRRAFDDLIVRHEIFRTTFEAADGQPFQVIHPPYPVDVPLLDLRTLPPADREAESERLIAAEFRRTFDVTKLPLARWTVIQIDDATFVLVQSEHHFVHDGWSIARLLGELKDLYTAHARGVPPALPEIPVQYADYVLWQRDWMRGPALDRLLGFWTKQLAGAPAVVNLPTDRPRPKFQTFRGISQFMDVPDDLYDDIRVFSRQEGVTPFMVMLSAFMTLLARYSGQHDLPVGSTVANRRLHELEPLIGMVVNPIVLRGDLSGDPTFAELVKRVRAVALAAYAHQDLPFEKIVQALHPERDPSHNPIFQVMFSFHDAPVPDLDFDGARGAIDYRYNGSAKFEWNIVVLARREQRVGRTHGAADERVTVEWEYNTDLFDDATIARVLRQYRNILAAVVRDPTLRHSRIPLLSAEERAAIIADRNRTATDYPRDLGLHDLVAARCERDPARRAVVGPDGTLTAGELLANARRVAAVLRARGVGPDVLVGVALERTTDLVVALLGVHLAGGAYVPMDPSHPRSRLELMVEDSQMAVVITERALAERVPAGRAAVVFMDQLPAAGPFVLPETSPEHLAYVIYTSGSTGRPKGVAVPHRAVVNFMSGMIGTCGIGAHDVLLAVTTVSFDIAGLEIFLPLCAGATTWLASREDAADPVRLAQLLVESAATVMQATPATWRMLIDGGWAGNARITALCGGEALPPDLAQELRRRTRRTLNLYGPTETTIWSAAYEVRGGENPVPLGDPIANTTLHVLDPHLEPMPPGVPGELYIGGAGVARGYLGRPELTAERFVPDPFGAPGARLYRTGDLARRRADGALEFLGRLDHQVKIRGFRIELGEIEAALRGHPGVRDVVVLAIDRAADDRRLVAWVVPEASTRPTAGELREFLARTLPDYMVPTHFVALDALPLNANGKVDRRALPPPVYAEVHQGTGETPPLTETQARIAQVWCEVLGVAAVAPADNFFDLGGHSLLVMKVLSRIESETSVRLGARDMMLQNLGQLAAIIDERAPGKAGNSAAAPAPEPAGLFDRLRRKLFSRGDGS